MSAVNTGQAIPMEMVRKRDHFDSTYDSWLISAVLLLIGLGLVMVASASVSLGDRELEQPLYFFWRQALFVLIGLSLMAITLYIPLTAWQGTGAALLLVCIVLLVMVLIPGIGREVNGSIRWIRFGAFNLQPSELVKICMPIYLAGYLIRRGNELRDEISGFLKPMAVLMVITGLLLLEPDYGATVVLFATVLGMLFMGGVPLLRFSAWVAATGMVMAGVVMLAPYRVQRLTAFIDPWADPFDSGFQLTQALIAVGRGEWFGVGLGGSVQKLFYLPEAHTDFLFAVMGEELGFAGMALVIGLFTFILWRAFRIAQQAEEQGHLFGAYLAYGLGLGIGLQAFINMGVNIGLLPTKGLTLPLMSYGGSSMLANCLAVGLLLRVDHELRQGEQAR